MTAVPWSETKARELRAKREAMSLSQRELGRLVGKSPSYVSELERAVHPPSEECADLIRRVFEGTLTNGETVPGSEAPLLTSRRPRWSIEDGRWLRVERRKRGLTQAALGAVIGRTGARIGEFERAHHGRGPTGPSHQQLRAIKEFFARTPTSDSEKRDGAKARFTVEIDEKLMNEALEVSGARTKTGAVEEALRELVRAKRIEKLLNMIGNYEIDLTLEELRRMRGCE